MANSQSPVEVVVVPFPAHGHLTPLLRLSRRVSSHNIPVHYVASATHIRQATARVHGWDPSATTNLHLHSFPTPSFQNLQPNSSDSSYNYPSHLGPMIAATLSSFREPFHHLINKLSIKNHKRVVLIFDSLMASVVQSVHSLPNVESYCFETISAFTLHSSSWEAAGEPNVSPEAAAVIMKQLPSQEGCCSPEFQEFLKLQHTSRTFHSGTLYNTSRLIEGLYLDRLSKLRVFGPDKHWAVGPLNPVFRHEKPGSRTHSNCLEWLDRQPQDSVMFVSFGTSSSLSDEQIRELAFGLERSGHRFIWALRDADRGDIFEGGVRRGELPQGFEERVRERGIVVRDWAPQLEILEHSATGGFLSHCGWNSCMESISMGVPIAAWPMHSDQPRNAVLITKVLEIGVEVRDWASRDNLVCSSVVEEAVRRLMEGDEVRQRAKKLADSIKQSMMEGGAAKMEMDSFIAHITR